MNKIYDDLKMYKYEDIRDKVEIMKLSSTKNNLEKYKNTKIVLYYEVAVKLKNELDQRIYKYKTLNEAISATYFLYLLVQKEGYNKIQDYKIFTTVKDEKGNIVIDDVTDNFHYWKEIDDTKIKQENELLKQKLKKYEKFLESYNITDEIIDKHLKDVQYTYYFRLRPPSIGTQPKDFVEFNPDPIIKNNRKYWGSVTYNRKLTKEEISKYDLDYIE